MERAVINKLIYPNYSYVTGCIHGDENASLISRRLDTGWLEEGEWWESEAWREERGRQRFLVQPDGAKSKSIAQRSRQDPVTASCSKAGPSPAQKVAPCYPSPARGDNCPSLAKLSPEAVLGT